MKTAHIRFTSLSPISFGRFHNTPKLDKESHDEYEKRTWKEKVHYSASGEVLIRNFAIKNMLSEAAKFLSIQIKGKGKATYTKHFEAGVVVLEDMPIGVFKSDVVGQWLHVPSDGRRGGSTRVSKCFPMIPDWTGDTEFIILDDTITEDVLMLHLVEAGKFIGMGSLRPRNNGILGRFNVELLGFS
jgi:hypothetical protein